MVIVLTGAIGIGKTTVCQKLIEILQARGDTCGGILTRKAEDKGITIEDIQSGEKETLASISKVYQGPRTARYYFNPEGIDFGNRAIDKGTSVAVLVIDEIGQLELRGEGFTGALEILKSGKVESCILVIRKELLSAFQTWFPTVPLVIETTVDNRNNLPQRIAVLLEKVR